ncbi:MAG: NifB/NifX family molybdenum-iron cluster-binding protein [Archaeoglobus sp.]|nr:NifB/NifX family molybdenum-iron cluster-binding protein [Archaeoglobus sp.]
MKVAIPCMDDRGLDSFVSQHFGRARYFYIAEIEDGEIRGEVVELPFEDHMPGDIPRFLQSLGVDTVLAYGLGMRAQTFFNQMGIRVITGAYGSVREVLEGFLKGSLVLDERWEEREDFRKHEGCKD